MRTWFGAMRSGTAAIAFDRATMLNQTGARVWTDVQWWPIRRIFGLGTRRIMFAVIIVEEPQRKRMDPAGDPA